MPNISVMCGEIQTDGGFEFKLPSDSLNQTLRGDCEQSWYLQDRRLIADPSAPQKLIAPVISVSSDRLVTSHCVNLNHEIRCDSAGLHFSHVTAFRARNQTAATPNPDDLNQVTLKLSDQLWWLLAVFIIIVLGFLCFLLRKRIFRTLMKVRSDDPHAVQESEQLKAPEIEV